MKIFLTKRAEKNYRTIKTYIAKEWGQEVAIAFEKKITDFLELLKNFPEIGLKYMKSKSGDSNLQNKHGFFTE